MAQPKLSVIIPVYNAEKYLRRCLNSVLEQSFSNLEILCVNDGSTDASINILNEYAAKDSRIVIVSQKNAGQSAARNVGLSAASGEYIGFVDSDDWIDVDFYQNLYQSAYQNNSEVTQCGYRTVSTKKTKTYNYFPGISEAFCDKLSALHKGFVVNKIYRRDFIQEHQLRFLEGLIFEDILFAVQAIYYAKMLNSISGGYYNYFSNPSSTVNSASYQAKRQRDSFTILQEMLNFGKKHLSHVEQKCLSDFVVEQMVQGYNISKKADYKKYLDLLGPSPLLRKKRLRAVKSKIFHFSWCHKELVVFGVNYKFWNKE